MDRGGSRRLAARGRAGIEFRARPRSAGAVGRRCPDLVSPRRGARRSRCRGPGRPNSGAWPGTVIASHKSAGQPFHKLTFRRRSGALATDPGMERSLSAFLTTDRTRVPFNSRRISQNITAEQVGGMGLGAMRCAARRLRPGQVRFGERTAGPGGRRAPGGLFRDNGWPCAVSKELGNFRGPGRKDDPCPFATLAMLKAVSDIRRLRDGAACRTGAEALLTLWSDSTTRHPYMFFMGTDFRKLKAPFVWYDLLHVLDVPLALPLAQSRRHGCWTCSRSCSDKGRR